MNQTDWKTMIPDKTIQCKGCGIEKHSSEFSWRRKDSGVTLDTKTCRSCQNVDNKAINRLKKIHPYPSDSICHSCGKEEKLALDHSHGKDKEFRGWLCSKCNVGIGNLGDTKEGVLKAYQYLIRFEERMSETKETKFW